MWIFWITSHWRLLLVGLLCVLLAGVSLTAIGYKASADNAQAEVASVKQALARVRAWEKVASETEATLEQIRATSGEANRGVIREIQTRTVYRDCIVPASGLRLVERARTGLASEPDAAMP